ncbi:MAG: glycoside hydrolase family 88 protein [Lachnospiraceae bacterium]|nr:glycoside hydrolase family 88 protein [Lachnospiraceae bacterium]
MNEKEWALSIVEKIAAKTKISAERSKDKVPFVTVNGLFDDWSDRISWWTNGFYAGQLWQLYHAYGENLFKEVAEVIEKKLDGSLMDYRGMDHDSGFKWLLTSVANYKLTGNKESKNRALLAAANLTGRFNLAGRFIRAWNDWNDENIGENAGWAIIDCMMNLPLLYWATEQTKDPRFEQIARAHADTAMKAFVRENGSVAHIVRFHPVTGEKIDTLGGQGIEVGSSWTRGQAWAVYGFALSYRHTKNEAYLETAKKVGRYFAESVPENGFVPVDFCQEPSIEWEDSSAAAIAACGMLEIEQYVEGEEKEFFHNAAMRLLTTLAEQRCNWSEETDNILEKCSSSYHEENHNYSLIYGDYYFTEAMLKLCDKELFMW